MKFGRNYNVRNVCDWMGFDYRQDYANCCCSYLEQTLESPELGTLTSGSCEWQTQGHTWCVCGWWWWQRQSQGRNFDTTESNHFFFSLLSFNLLMRLKKFKSKFFLLPHSVDFLPGWAGYPCVCVWCVVVHQKPEVALEIERKYTAAATAAPLPLSPIGYRLSFPNFYILNSRNNNFSLKTDWKFGWEPEIKRTKRRRSEKENILCLICFPFSKIFYFDPFGIDLFSRFVFCVCVGVRKEKTWQKDTHKWWETEMKWAGTTWLSAPPSFIGSLKMDQRIACASLILERSQLTSVLMVGIHQLTD